MRDKVTGVVLCGGRGTRLQGADKPLLEWQGRPCVTWVCAAIAHQVDRILISANRHLDEYRALGHEVITDELPDFQGPLSGIVSAANHCSSERMLICAGDTPGLPPRFAERLLTFQPHADLVVSRHQGRPQWLHCAIRPELMAVLRGYLAGGGRSAHGFFSLHAPVFLDFDASSDVWCNVNTPSDQITFPH